MKTYLAEVEGDPGAGDGPTPARGRRARRRRHRARTRQGGAAARRRRPRSRSASTRAATARCGGCARRSAIRCAGWCAPASGRCTTAGSARASGGALRRGRCGGSTRRRRRADGEQPRRRRTHRANLLLPMRLQALRGAITCTEDSKAEIDAKTARLVKELFARNELAHDDVVSIIFTTTPDLTAEFPATAARTALGLDDVALLGAQEQAVPHGTPHVHPGARALLLRPVPRRAAPRVPRGCDGVADRPRRRRLTFATRMSTAPESVALIGTGLIGGSIGLALRRDGVAVRGFDRDPARANGRSRPWARSTPLAADVADAVAGADLVVVAVPVGHVAEVVLEALDAGAALVTDVGSVKAPVVAAVEAARPDARGALRRWSPDGRLGAGGPGRGQRRPVRGRHVGAHAHRAHRPAGVRRGARRGWPGSAPRRSRWRPSCTTRWSRS